MTTLVVCIHVIVCLVLIIVILLQAGRGQGLTGASFGGNVQSLFGTKASSFLTKATTVSAILFLFTCIGLNIIDIQKSKSLFKVPSNQAPLDVDQIKKALEKIKTTDKAETAEVPTPKDAAKTAVDVTKTMAASAQSSLNSAAKDVVAEKKGAETAQK
ncbi:MAG TPA: preprotein translocase subunit SecG [Candidatus Omnitrophota bacterium]|nr:preprotein translocase subunit SecG [Candidatus Omnitrophota bacterium]